jgi:hypothetical protein
MGGTGRRDVQKTVEQIIRDLQSDVAEPRTNVASCVKKLRAVERILDQLMGAVRMHDEHERDADFDMIHRQILLVKTDCLVDKANAALAIGGFGPMVWDDPDASYEDDVRAWGRALKSEIRRIEAIRDANTRRIQEKHERRRLG